MNPSIKLQRPRVIVDRLGRHLVECFSAEQSEQVFADHKFACIEREKKERADREFRIMEKIQILANQDDLTAEEFTEKFMAIFDEEKDLHVESN